MFYWIFKLNMHEFKISIDFELAAKDNDKQYHKKEKIVFSARRRKPYCSE